MKKKNYAPGATLVFVFVQLMPFRSRNPDNPMPLIDSHAGLIDRQVWSVVSV
jgi:hypothetical protein